MKKLLALVLAMVMTLGLATVGASAATTKYADKDDIEFQEAADVLSTVGVFQGKGENFAPKDNLNRAEAAKLVAYLMLGTKTAEAIKGNGNKFSDVPADHFAAGYIEYLATAGVVSGVGDGKFNPNGQVTAVQFAKMLNVALGYDAQVEGYVGNSWNINIMKQANDDEIFKGLDVGSNDVLTREQAAQMCLNALKADTVEYESKGDTLTINNSTVVLNAKKAKDKTSSASKATKIDDERLNDGTYVLQLGEDLYNGDLVLDKTEDKMGRPVSKWTYKSQEIGKYATVTDRLIYDTKKVERGTVYSTLTKDVVDDLKKGIAEYEVYIDGVDVTANYVIDTDLAVKDSTSKSGIAEKGIITEVYKTENGAYNYLGNKCDQYTFVFSRTYLVKATANYSASNESVKIEWVNDSFATSDTTNLPTGAKIEIEQDDFNVADVKEDDYLVVTYSKSDNSFGSVQKATELIGKVSSFKDQDNIAIDGTSYSYNIGVGTDSNHGKKVAPDIDSEVKLILDPFGYIILVDDADSSSRYVYIQNHTAGGSMKSEAKAYFLDGTEKTIEVKKVTIANGTSYTATTQIQNNVQNNAWYTYTTDSSGKYTLKYVNAASAVKNTIYTQPAKETFTATGLAVDVLKSETVTGFIQKLGGTAANIKANNDTIVLVLDNDDDVTIYNGVSNIPDVKIKAGETTGSVYVTYIYEDTSAAQDFAKYVFVDASEVKTDIDDSKANDEYMFVVHVNSKEIKIGSNNSYAEVDLYDNSAKELNKKVKVDFDNLDEFAEGTLVKRVKTSATTGYLTGAKSVSDGGGWSATSKTANISGTGSSNTGINVSKGTLTINGTAFSLSNDRVVLVIDGDATAMLDDNMQGADYDVRVVSTNGLKSELDGYSYSYTADLILKDDGSYVADAVYIRITAATKGGSATPASSTTATSGPVAVMLSDNIRKGTYNLNSATDFTVYVAGAGNPNRELLAAMINNELEKYDANLKVKYTPTYDAAGNISNHYFTITDATGLVTEYGTKFEMNTDTATQTTKGTAVIKVEKNALSYNSSSATFAGLGNGTEKLVVQEGTTVTINANATFVDLIVSGNLNIKNGAKVTVNNNFQMSKSGHVEITEGQLVNTTGTALIDGSSTFVVANKDSNFVRFADATVYGHMDVNGGTFKVDNTLTLVKGAELDVNDATLNIATLTANSGTTTTISDSAVTLTTVANKTGSSITVSNSTGTIDANPENAVSGTVTSAKTLTVVPMDGVWYTLGNVKAQLDSDGKYTDVYTINSDTVTISLKQTAKNPSAVKTVTVALTDLTGSGAKFSDDDKTSKSVSVPVSGSSTPLTITVGTGDIKATIS